MTDRRRHRQSDADRATHSLAGLAFSLALVVIGLFLTQKLSETSRLEDCILAGRTNCTPIEAQ